MKKVAIVIAGIASGVATLVTAPVSAAGAFGNIGSIVFANGGCSSMGSTAFGNIGSIVGLDGGGNCNVNDVVSHAPTSSIGNIGSIVIDNACGDAGSFGNIGSIVLTNSGHSCHPSKPTTVVVERRERPTKVVEVVAPAPVATVQTVAVTKPAELPATGAGSVIGIAAGVTALGYVAAILRKRLMHNA